MIQQKKSQVTALFEQSIFFNLIHALNQRTRFHLEHLMNLGTPQEQASDQYQNIKKLLNDLADQYRSVVNQLENEKNNTQGLNVNKISELENQIAEIKEGYISVFNEKQQLQNKIIGLSQEYNKYIEDFKAVLSAKDQVIRTKEKEKEQLYKQIDNVKMQTQEKWYVAGSRLQEKTNSLIQEIKSLKNQLLQNQQTNNLEKMRILELEEKEKILEENNMILQQKLNQSEQTQQNLIEMIKKNNEIYLQHIESAKNMKFIETESKYQSIIQNLQQNIQNLQNSHQKLENIWAQNQQLKQQKYNISVVLQTKEREIAQLLRQNFELYKQIQHERNLYSEKSLQNTNQASSLMNQLMKMSQSNTSLHEKLSKMNEQLLETRKISRQPLLKYELAVEQLSKSIQQHKRLNNVLSQEKSELLQQIEENEKRLQEYKMIIQKNSDKQEQFSKLIQNYNETLQQQRRQIKQLLETQITQQQLIDQLAIERKDLITKIEKEKKEKEQEVKKKDGELKLYIQTSERNREQYYEIKHINRDLQAKLQQNKHLTAKTQKELIKTQGRLKQVTERLKQSQKKVVQYSQIIQKKSARQAELELSISGLDAQLFQKIRQVAQSTRQSARLKQKLQEYQRNKKRKEQLERLMNDMNNLVTRRIREQDHKLSQIENSLVQARTELRTIKARNLELENMNRQNIRMNQDKKKLIQTYQQNLYHSKMRINVLNTQIDDLKLRIKKDQFYMNQKYVIIDELKDKIQTLMAQQSQSLKSIHQLQQQKQQVSQKIQEITHQSEKQTQQMQAKYKQLLQHQKSQASQKIQQITHQSQKKTLQMQAKYKQLLSEKKGLETSLSTSIGNRLKLEEAIKKYQKEESQNKQQLDNKKQELMIEKNLKKEMEQKLTEIIKQSKQTLELYISKHKQQEKESENEKRKYRQSIENLQSEIKTKKILISDYLQRIQKEATQKQSDKLKYEQKMKKLTQQIQNIKYLVQTKNQELEFIRQALFSLEEKGGRKQKQYNQLVEKYEKLQAAYEANIIQNQQTIQQKNRKLRLNQLSISMNATTIRQLQKKMKQLNEQLVKSKQVSVKKDQILKKKEINLESLVNENQTLIEISKIKDRELSTHLLNMNTLQSKVQQLQKELTNLKDVFEKKKLAQGFKILRWVNKKNSQTIREVFRHSVTNNWIASTRGVSYNPQQWNVIKQWLDQYRKYIHTPIFDIPYQFRHRRLTPRIYGILDIYKRNKYIGLREYYLNKKGEYILTRRGFNVNVVQYQRFMQGIQNRVDDNYIENNH